MGDYRVEKVRVSVQIVMTDGARVAGALHLSPQSAICHGRQTLQEVLEEAVAFMPVTEEGGGFSLIGKAAVAALYADLAADPTPQFSRRARVAMKVEGAGSVDGEIIVPEGPAAFRVSDHLNGEGGWLRVEVGGTVAMVSKNAVKEIRLS